MADQGNLSNKRCIPCEGGVPALTEAEIKAYLPQVNGWEVAPVEIDGKEVNALHRRFQFHDFRGAMDFLRIVEEIAEGEGHHPDFCVHYNKVDFTLFTHAIGGLHDNDFILAAKIDEAEHEIKRPPAPRDLR